MRPVTRSSFFTHSENSRLPGEPDPIGHHAAGKREVDMYVRTYNTLLRSTGPINVETLEPAHFNIQSSLHAGLTESAPDMGAFMYSTLRLPESIVRTEHIVLGQSHYVFARYGYPDLDTWRMVTAPGRRRRWHDDEHGTLAVYVASSSDLDDLVPTIVAWQIEWNKMHRLLRDAPDIRRTLRENDNPNQRETVIRETLQISEPDWARLQAAWGDRFWAHLAAVAQKKKRLTIQMLGGTYVGYTRSTRTWWSRIENYLHDHDLAHRPLYFVSSNTHSIANILSGTARRRRDKLVRFVEQTDDHELRRELERLRQGDSRSSWDNFLYHTARLYYQANPDDRDGRDDEEHERGITTIDPGEGPIDVAAQVIDLSKLRPDDFDPRLKGIGSIDPTGTDAVVININYPLGMSAYHILNQLEINTHQLKGVYILGKAATLNARIGDVMLSDVVYDEHSGNTYWFNNAFSAEHLTPFLVYGSALDHQRAVTVLGTYLQNREYLDFFYRENFTVVEMEAGPYLSAIHEDAFLTRYGQEEHVNLVESPIDVGIIHYASDTPYTRTQTLGARGMSYYGMDSTYASTLVIMQRVFEMTGTLESSPHDPSEVEVQG